MFVLRVSRGGGGVVKGVLGYLCWGCFMGVVMDLEGC